MNMVGDSHTCATCGSFVTVDYVRIFGDSGGVEACPMCASLSDVMGARRDGN